MPALTASARTFTVAYLGGFVFISILKISTALLLTFSSLIFSFGSTHIVRPASALNCSEAPLLFTILSRADVIATRSDGRSLRLEPLHQSPFAQVMRVKRTC